MHCKHSFICPNILYSRPIITSKCSFVLWSKPVRCTVGILAHKFLIGTSTSDELTHLNKIVSALDMLIISIYGAKCENLANEKAKIVYSTVISVS